MATTPWGSLPIADAHVHFLSHSFFSKLVAQSKCVPQDFLPDHLHATIGTKLGWKMPPVDPRDLAAEWVSELDRHGVARAALIASVPGDEESVGAAIARFPDRFYGYFTVNPLAPHACEQTHKAFDLGLRGVCLFPAMHRY